MERVKAVVLLLLLFTHVFCQTAEIESWRENRRENLNEWPNSEIIKNILVKMTRKPAPHHYLRRIGKKDFAKLQSQHKRRKFQTFVALMGKRSMKDPGAMSEEN
ncbi:protachykinin isoform X2 [Cynoglossus semilaevis]|nr:protachykinin-like isoform X2 [Cynoglossus semilaevis]